MAQSVSPPPIVTPFGDTSASGVSRPWIRFFQELQISANTPDTDITPGPYANDAAAAAAGVLIGSMYYQPNGTVMVRLV
jgi:hypothetical protein